MFITSSCRCRALLKLSQCKLSSDLSHKIDLRCYTTKPIYSSQSPHEKYTPRKSSGQGQAFKNKNFNQKESYKKSYGQGQAFKNKNFNQKESYKKSYGHKDGSYEAKNKYRNPAERNKFVQEKKAAPIEIFDTNYAFLDNTEKVRIKPRSPLAEEEEEDEKPDKLLKRNYKITDNPLYSSELSYERDDEENDDAQFARDSVEHTSHDGSDQQLRKKYSFDSNLVFEEDLEDASPLKLEIVNAAPSSDESTTECTVDTTSIEPRTDSSLRPRFKIIDTPEGQITLNLADDEFDMKDFVKEFDAQIAGPLDDCKEDISYFGPDFSPTFNFAAYADKSSLIQQYVKLGVQLYKIEKNMDHMRALLSVDLENELPLYIQFLHDCGVPANCLGDCITQNPMILKEDLDDMKTRIRYLMAHKFTPESIARIITKNPSWLVWATKFIDERLGHFQNEFKLSGSEMRFLAAKAPKLITYPMRHVNENTFAVKEQMGFRRQEMKLLLLYKPRLWMNSRKKIVDSFDYLHNTMKLSHLTIATQADVMTTRKSRIKNRHEFLVELNKDQYNPKKSGYIAPKTMVIGSDADFCTNVAKVAVDTYNLFLKTR